MLSGSFLLLSYSSHIHFSEITVSLYHKNKYIFKVFPVRDGASDNKVQCAQNKTFSYQASSPPHFTPKNSPQRTRVLVVMKDQNEKNKRVDCPRRKLDQIHISSLAHSANLASKKKSIIGTGTNSEASNHFLCALNG